MRLTSVVPPFYTNILKNETTITLPDIPKILRKVTVVLEYLTNKFWLKVTMMEPDNVVKLVAMVLALEEYNYCHYCYCIVHQKYIFYYIQATPSYIPLPVMEARLVTKSDLDKLF